MIMATDNIIVAIKARPYIARELSKNVKPRWNIREEQIFQIDENGQKNSEPYTFDHIFNVESSNQDVYKEVVQSLVHSCMGGFNATIFAYGQTSSGKTYTMMGNDRNEGIIQLAVNDIFNHIIEHSERKFFVRCSFFEIYNENVNDLLDKSKQQLQIREDYEGKIKVPAFERVANTAQELIGIMKEGNQNRKTGETKMNSRSSRSHTIFRINIESVQANQPDGRMQFSQLNLVDLAGSERIHQTKAQGKSLKEGVNINKSLSVLGNVIRQLGENEGHISYRDSKLTRILQVALGGNAKSLIITTITLAAGDETKSTLEFAQRAKRVKNKPKINEMLTKEDKETLAENYKVTLEHATHKMEELQKEINRLKSEQSLLVAWKSSTTPSGSNQRRHTFDSYASYLIPEFLQKGLPHDENRINSCPMNTILEESLEEDLEDSCTSLAQSAPPRSTEEEPCTLLPQTPLTFPCETPPSAIRRKYQHLEKSYLELKEFTTLEKQLCKEEQDSELEKIEVLQTRLGKAEELIQNLNSIIDAKDQQINKLVEEARKKELNECKNMLVGTEEVEGFTLFSNENIELKKECELLREQLKQSHNKIAFLEKEFAEYDEKLFGVNEELEQKTNKEILSKLFILHDILQVDPNKKFQGVSIQTDEHLDRIETNGQELDLENFLSVEDLSHGNAMNGNLINNVDQLGKVPWMVTQQNDNYQIPDKLPRTPTKYEDKKLQESRHVQTETYKSEALLKLELELNKYKALLKESLAMQTALKNENQEYISALEILGLKKEEKESYRNVGPQDFLKKINKQLIENQVLIKQLEEDKEKLITQCTECKVALEATFAVKGALKLKVEEHMATVQMLQTEKEKVQKDYDDSRITLNELKDELMKVQQSSTKLNKQNIENMNYITLLKEEKNKLQIECNKYKTSLEETVKLHTTLSNENEQYLCSLKILQTDKEMLQAEWDRSKALLEKSEVELSKLKLYITNLNIQCTENKCHITHLEEENDNLTKECNKYKYTLKENVAEQAVLKHEIEEHLSALKIIGQEKDELLAKYRVSTDDMMKTREELLEFQKSITEINVQHGKEIDKINMECNESKAALEKSYTEERALRNKIEEYRSTVKELQTEKERLQKIYDESRAAFKHAEEEFAKLQDSYKEIDINYSKNNARIKVLEHENDSLKMECEKYKSAIEKSLTAQTSLNIRINESLSAFETLQKEKDNLQAEYDKCRTALEISKGEFAKLQKSFTKLDIQYMTTNEEKEKLSTECNKYKTSLQEFFTAEISLNIKIEEQLSTIKMLQKEKEILEAKCNESKTALGKSENELVKLQEHLNKVDIHYSKSSAYNKLQDGNEKLKIEHDIRNLEVEQDKLQVKHDKCRAAVQKTEEELVELKKVVTKANQQHVEDVARLKYLEEENDKLKRDCKEYKVALEKSLALQRAFCNENEEHLCSLKILQQEKHKLQPEHPDMEDIQKFSMEIKKQGKTKWTDMEHLTVEFANQMNFSTVLELEQFVSKVDYILHLHSEYLNSESLDIEAQIEHYKRELRKLENINFSEQIQQATKDLSQLLTEIKGSATEVYSQTMNFNLNAITMEDKLATGKNMYLYMNSLTKFNEYFPKLKELFIYFSATSSTVKKSLLKRRIQTQLQREQLLFKLCERLKYVYSSLQEKGGIKYSFGEEEKRVQDQPRLSTSARVALQNRQKLHDAYDSRRNITTDVTQEDVDILEDDMKKYCQEIERLRARVSELEGLRYSPEPVPSDPVMIKKNDKESGCIECKNLQKEIRKYNDLLLTKNRELVELTTSNYKLTDDIKDIEKERNVLRKQLELMTRPSIQTSEVGVQIELDLELPNKYRQAKALAVMRRKEILILRAKLGLQPEDPIPGVS